LRATLLVPPLASAFSPVSQCHASSSSNGFLPSKSVAGEVLGLLNKTPKCRQPLCKNSSEGGRCTQKTHCGHGDTQGTGDGGSSARVFSAAHSPQVRRPQPGVEAEPAAGGSRVHRRIYQQGQRFQLSDEASVRSGGSEPLMI